MTEFILAISVITIILNIAYADPDNYFSVMMIGLSVITIVQIVGSAQAGAPAPGIAETWPVLIIQVLFDILAAEDLYSKICAYRKEKLLDRQNLFLNIIEKRL